MQSFILHKLYYIVKFNNKMASIVDLFIIQYQSKSACYAQINNLSSHPMFMPLKSLFFLIILIFLLVKLKKYNSKILKNNQDFISLSKIIDNSFSQTKSQIKSNYFKNNFPDSFLSMELISSLLSNIERKLT